jgi:response regulator RpfG family c-di-GMP phosphodiesterase
VTEPLRIRLVTPDASLASAIEAIVAAEPDVVMSVDSGDLASVAWASGPTPHAIIVVDPDGTSVNLDTIEHLRALSRFTYTRILLMRPRLEAGEGAAELSRGVHDFVAMPIVPAEIAARLHMLADLHRLQETLNVERARSDHMSSAFHSGYDQIIRLLIRLVDLHFPGAEARGTGVASLSVRVASRFRVPERLVRDMEMAARLHEVGRMALADESDEEDDDDEEEGDRDRRPALNPGAAALASRALLEEIDGLKGVAEELGAVYENWDGTGVPERWMQGQIPLRSRILRVAIDYLVAIERRPNDIADVLDRMDHHAGTAYDPLVLAHLRAALDEEGGAVLPADSLHVAIDKLRVGMVLAEDLYTDNGIKLLTRGVALTPASIETIRRRHRMEPILRGAVVEREAA